MRRGLLVWVDLEFTGLDFDKDRILELASVVTDARLRVVGEGPDVVVHQPARVLSGMDEWNQKHHKASGLLDEVRKSKETVKSAEKKTLSFLLEHCLPHSSPLCGNSVHVDRYFMRKHMPRLESFFHNRNVDVSTVKELVRRWYPDLPGFRKGESHRAQDDVMESIAELKYYRENVFR